MAAEDRVKAPEEGICIRLDPPRNFDDLPRVIRLLRRATPSSTGLSSRSLVTAMNSTLRHLVSVGSVFLVLIGFGCGGSGASTGYALSGGSTTTYSASGNIVTSEGTPLFAVSIALTGSAQASTATDAYGNFSFSGLGTGSYTVTPALLDFTFDPTSASFSISNSNSTGLNFIATSFSTTTSLIATYMANLRTQTADRFLTNDQAIVSSTEANGTPGTTDHYLQSQINYEKSVQAFLDNSLDFIKSKSHSTPIDKAAIIRLLNAQNADDRAYSKTYYNGTTWATSAPNPAATIATTISAIDTYLDNAYKQVTAEVEAIP